VILVHAYIEVTDAARGLEFLLRWGWPYAEAAVECQMDRA
jgi:hypothetical protein